VTLPKKRRTLHPVQIAKTGGKNTEEDSDSSAANGIGATGSDAATSSDESEPSKNEEVKLSARARKRKRGDLDDNLEQQYMDRLVREEAREAAKASKAVKDTSDDGSSSGEDVDMVDAESEDGDVVDSDDEVFTAPQHEALAKPEDTADFEKASRTVFLGNVSTEAITSKTAKKTLFRHLQSILPSLPALDNDHSIESFRFRSTAYATKLPKKAAFAKKDLMDATSKSTNAYAVYGTKLAAREAVKQLNGTIVLDRHLRVDQVAHPAKTDHKRCVFVGNLDFVDDDTQIREDNQHGEDKKRKKRTPGDVEEGLWRQMGKAGKVESVRVVRDPKTRVGKGFAYVQFIVSSTYCNLLKISADKPAGRECGRSSTPV
jgi:nucleolar protein 12